MAVNVSNKNNAYGLNAPLINVFPRPIVSNRAPTGKDKAPVGTVWCDIILDDVYILASVRDNLATWINSGGGGGVFANLTVADFLTVGGTVTFTDLDPDSVVFTNGARELIASAGNDGALIIGSTAGAPDWATLTSGDGSVVIANGANSIDLTVSGATASTFPTDAGVATPVLGATTFAGGVNVGTTGAGDTVTINVIDAPTFAGLITGDDGLEITAGSTHITSNSNTGSDIFLHADGGANETIVIRADQGNTQTSIYAFSDVGGIQIEATALADNDAIFLVAGAGGITLDAALQTRIDSAQNAVDAVLIRATNASGGVDIDSGSGGIDIDTTGAITLDATAASHFTTTGAFDLTVSSTLGRIVVQSEKAAADALRFVSGVGGLDTNVALQMNLDSSQAAANAVRIIASDGAGGIDIDAGTGGITVDTTNTISLDSATASNFTVTGAADLTLSSTAGSINVSGGEAAADALRLLAAAGGLDTNVALQMNLDSSQAAADAIRIIASNGAGGIDIDAGTGAITLDTTGVLSLDSAAASNFTVTGAFDLTLNSTAGSVVVTGGEAAVDAITLTASNGAGGIDINAGSGGVTIDTTAAISLDSATASNFTISGVADLTLNSTGGGVDLISGEATATAISMNASNAAGGIGILSGTGGFNVGTTGAITMASQVASEIGTTTNAVDMSVTSALGSVNIIGAENATDAVKISASHATGGILLDAGVVPGVRITNGTQTAQILVGTGSPDGSVVGLQGSIFLRVNGGAGTSLYTNTDGNMAWSAV